MAATKRILVPIAEGFEEIETITIVDVLRRAGLEVVTAGLKRGPLVGSRRVPIVPDIELELVKDEEFDMIILPGGQPGTDHLRKHPAVLEILKKMNLNKKWIGAICAAPLVLRDAGLTQGLKLTSHPSVQRDLHDADYDEARVVMDGRVITSRGPGTAMEFSLKIVE